MSYPPKRPRRSHQPLVQEDVRKLAQNISETHETVAEDPMNQTQEQRMKELDRTHSEFGVDDVVGAREDMEGRVRNRMNYSYYLDK